MSAPVWHPTPKPGEMKMCLSCPHYRHVRQHCSLAQPGKVPPLTSERGGKEYCGLWPPKEHAADPGTPTLFAEAAGA